MSGFVCSIALGTTAFTSVKADPPQGWDIEYIEFDGGLTEGEEAAGKVGKALGVIAAIFVPFAAPALWTALTTSGGLLSGLAGAASSTFGAALTNTVGSALVAGALNAGAAYLGGARGGEVWQAFGGAALQSGIGSLTRAATSAIGGQVRAPTQVPNQTPANVTGAVNSTAGLTGTTFASSNLTSGVTQAGVGAANLVPGASSVVSNPIMNGIRNILGNVSPDMLRRTGAAVINAAVNGESLGRLDAMVEQQRAELEAIRAADQGVYNQKIAEAQKILADADKMDPTWRGKMAMADVAGMEATQSRQTMRDIATKQGGSLDAGQRKAYQRSAGLHTARSTSLAYNRGYSEAEIARNQLRAAGSQLLTPNDAAMRGWQFDTELEAARQRAHTEANQNTAGLFADAFFGSGTFNPAPSPVPGSEEEDDDTSPYGFGGGNRGGFG